MTNDELAACSLRITGIKCDAEGCDYHDENVRAEEYESYLDQPCPKCGESLLTQEDLDLMRFLYLVTDALNEIAPKPDADDPVFTVGIEMDGSGIPKFREAK